MYEIFRERCLTGIDKKAEENVYLLKDHIRDNHYYEQQELPATRQEFENRSMLYHILEDMKSFLEIKKKFVTVRK